MFLISKWQYSSKKVITDSADTVDGERTTPSWPAMQEAVLHLSAILYTDELLMCLRSSTTSTPASASGTKNNVDLFDNDMEEIMNDGIVDEDGEPTEEHNGAGKNGEVAGEMVGRTPIKKCSCQKCADKDHINEFVFCWLWKERKIKVKNWSCYTWKAK
jgi:hypothetical protein